MLPADLTPFEFWFTLGAVTFGFGLAAAMAVLERRPRKDISTPLIPTTPVMFAGAVIGVLALFHLLGIFGLQSGR